MSDISRRATTTGTLDLNILHNNEWDTTAPPVPNSPVNPVSALMRRASTTDRPRRTLTKCRSKPENMHHKQTVISPQEFEALPASIQYAEYLGTYHLAC